MENIKNILDSLNIYNQKKDFDFTIENIVFLLKNKFNINIKKQEVCIKKNIIKIKTNSNKKFLIFLNLNKINQEINLSNKGFIVRL